MRSHIRSAPDNYKWNNHSPSRNSDQLMNPRSRDSDGDRAPNYLDHDDDNHYDTPDDYNSSQY